MAGLDTEIQTFDSQSLSPSSPPPGNKLKDRIGDEHQNTVPFDDTVALESPSVDTKLENLDVDTEVLDIPDCLENMRTQTVDDYEEEVVLDSDDEGTYRIEVRSVMKELFSDKTDRKVGRNALDLEKRQLTSPCEQDKDFVAGSVASAGKQCYVGYLRRGFRSVCAHSVRASGFVRRTMTDKGSSSGSNSIHADTHSQKQLGMKDNGTFRVGGQFLVDTNVKEVVQDYDNWECNGQMSDFKDEIKSGDMLSKLSTGDMLDGRKVSSSNYEATDRGKDTPLLFDQELARLSYIESQEPGESSQANALDFVNCYLSFNNVNLSEEVTPRTTNRGKSPPILSAKGPQSLARRTNLRTTIGESGTYEWDDNQIDDGGVFFSRNRRELILDCEGHGPRSVTRPQSAGNMNVQKQRNLDVQCKETGSNHSDSRLKVHNFNEIGGVVKVSEMKIEKSFVKELDEQFNAEPSGKQLETGGAGRDVPEMFDVGFDTQMAAEAMEALLYAPPPDCSADCAHQGPQNMLEDSSEGATKNKSLKDCSFSKRAHSDSGVIARQSKRTKRPANKLSRNISSSFQKHTKNQKESDPELPVAKKVKRGKSLAENHLNCRIPANAKKSSCGRSYKLIDQGKEERAPEKNIIKEVDKNFSSSISIEHKSIGKGPRGKRRKFSPIAHQTRCWSSVKSLNKTEDPINSSRERMNNVTEVGVLKKRRKRGSLDADVFQVSSVSGECPKLGSNTSAEATNSEVNPKGQTELNVDVGITANPMKLDAWSYPRGKRKVRNVPGHSNGASNLCAPFTVVYWEKGNGYSIESNKKSKGNSKIACFSFDVKRKARSSVYTRHQSSLAKKCEESKLRQNFDESNSEDVIICDSALLNMKKIPIDLDRAKASRQSGKLDDVDSISSANGAEKNIKLDGLSNVNNKASPIYKVDENDRQPCKKNFSRLPLMKELIGLGIAESLPNFASKDLRRRRDIANVRVLFSQNMDDDTIKQQKKILARLGISIASCCSDATHFITDRFVRTRNMLEAIALGKPVVTHLWLESCGQASCFIDEKNYILRDAKKEKEIGFSMPVSLARASQHPLLKGQRVFITPNIKPGEEMIASLVKAVHGQAVDRIQQAAMKNEMIPDDLLILSCEKDYAMCAPFLEKGAAVYCSELLLNGIVIQKLEYERHQLFTNHVERNCSSRCPRKDADLSLSVARRR